MHLKSLPATKEVKGEEPGDHLAQAKVRMRTQSLS